MHLVIAIWVRVSVSLCFAMSLAWSADALDIDATGKATFNQDVAVSASTASSSKETGALVVSGGVGIEKDLHIGGTVVKGDVAAYCTVNDTVSFTAWNEGVINFMNVVNDTHSAVSTGSDWKYTAPQKGWYRVSIGYRMASATSTYAILYKNNVLHARIASIATANLSARGSMDVQLDQGDYIQIRAVASQNNTLLNAYSAGLHFITIVKN